MNDDERRMHDWFDEELDRMSISGDRPVDPRRVFASETDRALSETASELRRMDARQSAEPSSLFLTSLEQDLMISPKQPEKLPLGTAKRKFFGLLEDDSSELPSSAVRSSSPWMYTTMALVGLLIAGTISISHWTNGGENGTGSGATTQSAFVQQQQAATASAVVQNDVVGDELPPIAPLDPESRAEVAWETTISDEARGHSTGNVVLANGMIYRQLTVDSDDEGDAFTRDEDGNMVLVHEGVRFDGIQAIDAATGETKWKFYFGWGRAGLAADDYAVYSVTVANEIVALDVENGEVLWIARVNAPIVNFALRNGAIYAWDSGYTLTALDAQTGTTTWTSKVEGDEAWQLGLDGAPLGASGIVVGSVSVAVVSADNRILTFDRQGGDLLWQATELDTRYTQLYATDSVILAISSGGRQSEAGETLPASANAFDFTTGKQLWRFVAEDAVLGAVAINGSGIFAVSANDFVAEPSIDSNVTLVDYEEDGSNALWTGDGATPTWADSDASVGRFVFGVDAETGSIVWQRSAVASGFWGVYSANGNASQVLAVTNDNQIVLLDGATGQVLTEPVTLPPASPVSQVFVGSASEGVFVIARGKTAFSFWQSST